MKIWKRALLIALCALMILAMPFVLCAGEMLGDTTWVDGGEDDLTFDFDFSRLLFPSAYAEEEKSYALPIDFSAGMRPNPDGYTEDGYQDDSITVRMETREENGVTWRLAFVEIKDPSQLRTATAGKLKYTDKTTALVSVMACAKNAVVAINGDYFTDDQAKRSFEYRMGEPVKSNDGNPKGNKKRDILIIDENGDFHTFVCSDKDGMKEFAQSGRKIVNAFTFGPALVQEGQLLEIDRNYSYNPNKPEPRAAIGQMGRCPTCSYWRRGAMNRPARAFTIWRALPMIWAAWRRIIWTAATAPRWCSTTAFTWIKTPTASGISTTSSTLPPLWIPANGNRNKNEG